MKCCKNCKHSIPCKHHDTDSGTWQWFRICRLLEDEKDGWCITIRDDDICEEFQPLRGEVHPLDEPNKLKWTSNPSCKISRFEVCSSCWIGVKPIEDYYNFCPHCGKKWRKVDVY